MGVDGFLDLLVVEEVLWSIHDVGWAWAVVPEVIDVEAWVDFLDSSDNLVPNITSSRLSRDSHGASWRELQSIIHELLVSTTLPFFGDVVNEGLIQVNNVVEAVQCRNRWG